MAVRKVLKLIRIKNSGRRNDARRDSATAEIERLANLSALKYEIQRGGAAKRLNIRVAALDRLVRENRDKAKREAAGPTSLSFLDIEPWPAAVDGVALLKDLTAAVSRYVSLETVVARVIALWVVHTHSLDACSTSPRLAIKSPVKNCGKSTLLEVLSYVVHRPLLTANITAPGVFRVIDSKAPTLLIDEAYTYLVNNEELRGILNSGHRRNAGVIRVDGENLEPRILSTWGAAAIAGIGSLPDTIEDRSHVIRLRRRRPDEHVEVLNPPGMDELRKLARKAARWASDHLAELKTAQPEIPRTLVNRQADNWRCLFAIADVAGGKWPTKIREVADRMTRAAQNADHSVKITLLRDIRAVFQEAQAQRMSSADMVAHLTKIEGGLWSEWKGNQPTTQNAIARLLADFDIAPENKRFGSKVLKGYEVSQFADAFSRYL
jgi:putative DNA primase/helicase